MADNLPNFICLFTEGSKIDNSVTFGINSHNKVLELFKLPNYLSEFTAELTANFRTAILASKLNSSDTPSSVNCNNNINLNNKYAKVIK